MKIPFKQVYPGCLFSVLLLMLVACEKENKTQFEPQTNIYIKHDFLGKPFSRDSTYTDLAENQLSFKTFQYYLSNFTLIGDNPSNDYLIPNGFYLIKGFDNQGTYEISLKNIPVRNYRGLRISIGLDSATNKSTGGTGALNPGNGMYWDWSKEYKFLVMEGNYRTSAPTDTGSFLFHIAGNSNYRTVYIPFSSNSDAIEFGSGSRDVILTAEISSLFGEPEIIDFRNYNNVISNETGAWKIAENYEKAGFLQLYAISKLTKN